MRATTKTARIDGFIAQIGAVCACRFGSDVRKPRAPEEAGLILAQSSKKSPRCAKALVAGNGDGRMSCASPSRACYDRRAVRLHAIDSEGTWICRMKTIILATVCALSLAGAARAEPPAVAQHDPALVATPLNTKPGPEYQSAARLYQGVPSLARDDKSGRLWATWFSGGRDEAKENYVVVVTSGDDGATWTEPVLVVDPPNDHVRTFDPCLWTTSYGRLLLFYTQNKSAEKKLHDGRWGVWFTTCEDPTRADSAWSAPQRICDGIMLNKPTVLRDGTWLLPVAHWYDHNLGTGVVRSTDQGKTFAKIGGSLGRSSPGGIGGGMEHILIERQDGSLWMPMRLGDGIGESTSTDGGVTWTKPVRSAMAGPAARFHVRRLKSGRLLMINHVGFDPMLWPPANRRSHLTALLSDDDGKTWPHTLLLDDRLQVSYPDAIETPDGKLYIIYDRERTGAREILMAVTSETEILAGKPSADTRLRVLISKATGKR